MKIRLLILMVLGYSVLVNAQGKHDNDEPKEGYVELNADPRVDSLLFSFEQIALANPQTKGFQIQIFASRSRNEVYKTKAKFEGIYKEIGADVDYEAPNFKLRVGYYRNKLAAHRDLLEVTKHFPDAFILQAQLPLEELE